MTREDLVAAADEAVRRAQQYEVGGYEDQAENYWEVAERLYEDAGIDTDWFDHRKLSERLDEPKKPLWPFLLPTGEVEFTEDEDPNAPVRGIVADPRVVERLRP